MPAPNNYSFAEKVVLVTNGAHGVGRAAALQLAMTGAYVIVHYAVDDAEGAEVVAELREFGTLALALAGDITDEADVARMFSEIDAAYGRLDMLVHVAAQEIEKQLTPQTSESPADLSIENWDAALRFGARSALLCARAAEKLMQSRPSPVMIFVAEQAEATAPHGDAANIGACAATFALARHLAVKLAPRTRVNAVAIKPSDVPADEVARACYYLLSSEARFITGQIISVGK